MPPDDGDVSCTGEFTVGGQKYGYIGGLRIAGWDYGNTLYQSTVNYDIHFVGGIINTLFGVEVLFFATLTGPGNVWIQSLPISRLAGRILAYGTYARKEEGSILGGIGNILDGDGWK